MDEKTARRREILIRIYSEVLPGIAKEYKHMPDFLIRKIVPMYLNKEEKQDAVVRMCFSSKVFKSLSREEKNILSEVTGDDILETMQKFSHLPKVSTLYKILNENRELFNEVVRRGCQKIKWDE